MQERRGAFGDDDLAFERPHRRAQPDLRRQRRIAEAGGEHDAARFDGPLFRGQPEAGRCRDNVGYAPVAQHNSAAPGDAQMQGAQQAQGIGMAVERTEHRARD